MKKHVYLITTAAAALLAGTVFAAAQGMQKQAPGGAAEQSPPSQGQGQEQKKEQTQPGQKQGQNQKEGQKQDQGQKQAQPKTDGQGQKQDQGQKEAQPQTQGQGQGKQDAQQKSGGSVTFTTEQRTRVRTTVLQDSNAPRATNVNFSINVGTAVPTSVRVVTVPQLILEVQPEWRGHMYFIVGDQIIIVDRNHRIVAVIDV
jgi:DNA mismatch repair ATPase MutL